MARRDAGLAAPWDMIWRTPAWDVVHAYDTSVLGWLVLVLRRHAQSLAELTDDEAAELGPLCREVSRALGVATGCAKTYAAQFAEHPQHPHVHVHLIARASGLPASQRGPAIFTQLGVAPEVRTTEAEMNGLGTVITAELRRTSGVSDGRGGPAGPRS